MKITASRPLKLKLPDGVMRLQPGVATEVPDPFALRLLAQKPEAVRQSVTVLEPAVRPDGRPLSLVYWEDAIGKIRGPAIPEFVARSQGPEQFWIVTTCEGQTRWTAADRLRERPTKGDEGREGNRR
jgi:hypothetical protein